MPSFWERFIRSGFGTRAIFRRIRALSERVQLKRDLRARNDAEPLIRSKRELGLLMRDHPYIDDAEIALLSRLARESGCIVEIGSAFGASAAVFLANCAPMSEVHSIDPFVQDSMSSFQATEKKCRDNVALVLVACGKSDMLKRWHLHTDYSYNVVDSWNLSIDLLFIDGDHRYESVRKDFEDWLPFVKRGGYILFHDSRRKPGAPDTVFRRGWPGPTRLADELRHDPSVLLASEAFSITAWKKN